MPSKRLTEDWRNYNPLDKANVRPDVGKSNRLPYSKKDQAISLLEMVQPKVSSLGVLPSRNTEEIENLNVMLVGDSLDAEAVEQSDFDIEIKDSGEELKDKRVKKKKGPIVVEKVKMPAIVSSEGTISAPVLVSRGKPPPRPKPKIKKWKRKPVVEQNVHAQKEKQKISSRQSLSSNI